MITGKDIKPDRQIYRLGAVVLEQLKHSADEQIDLFSLFESIRSEENISLGAFFRTLDWLYLLGALEAEQGELVKCS